MENEWESGWGTYDSVGDGSCFVKADDGHAAGYAGEVLPLTAQECRAHGIGRRVGFVCALAGLIRGGLAK
jgi:hypothetical protein